MLEGVAPFWQAATGTLFTWGLTAAGSSLVFFFNTAQRQFLDGSLGFAAGVMIAASYWSLLEPAIETAVVSGIYGDSGQYAYLPVGCGFAAGAAFVYAADCCLQKLGVHNPALALSSQMSSKKNKESVDSLDDVEFLPSSVVISGSQTSSSLPVDQSRTMRQRSASRPAAESVVNGDVHDVTLDDKA